MRMKFSSLLFIAGLLAVQPSLAAAADSAIERQSLTGLAVMSVVVEDLGPLVARLGLTTDALQRDVESRLKKAGLSISADADAYLYVHVTVADPGGSLPLPFIVDVSLMQEVTLPRGIKTRTPLQCPTWSLNRLGLASADRVRGLLGDRVNEFVDQFVVAYRSVNPRG